MLEAEALHTAADIAPRHGGEGDGRLHGGGQGAQIQTEIDGRAQPLGHQGREQQPSSGKSRKVLAITTRCSRQWPRPASRFWRDSLAPCMKNKQRHRQLGQQTEPDGHLPLAGKKGGQGDHGNQHRGKRIQTHGSPEKRVPHGMGTDRARGRRHQAATPDTKGQAYPEHPVVQS